MIKEKRSVPALGIDLSVLRAVLFFPYDNSFSFPVEALLKTAAHYREGRQKCHFWKVFSRGPLRRGVKNGFFGIPLKKQLWMRKEYTTKKPQKTSVSVAFQ